MSTAVPSALFCVEFRNRELATAATYAELLKHEIVPAMTSWTRMSPISDQWKRFEALAHKTPFLVARPVLRPGKRKEDADAQYDPFDRIHEKVQPVRTTIQEMTSFAVSHGIPAYFLISNTIEGCAHRTISEIADALEMV